MRCYPTDRMLGLTPGDADDDNLYLEALRVNEPLIVRAQSVDGNYFLCISSCLSVSWVPAADIAICANKDEWLVAWDIPEGQELVVYDYKVRTEQTRETPNTANRLMYMGTVLFWGGYSPEKPQCWDFSPRKTPIKCFRAQVSRGAPGGAKAKKMH